LRQRCHRNVGRIGSAIGGQGLAAARTVAADLLEQIGDPTKVNVLANTVFPDGPSMVTKSSDGEGGSERPSGSGAV
jgi:hypothetical protein